MYRRLISVSVLAAFVAAQAAALPHGHAQGSPKGHDATPHIHLRGANVSSHEHGHTHPHTAGHVNRHAEPVDQHEEVRAKCGLNGVADHDADVIYLPPSVSTTVTSGSDQSKLLTSPALLHFVDAAAFEVVVTAYQAALLRLPGERAPECDFCLTLRALRI